MEIKPKITLVIKGASSHLKSQLIKRVGMVDYLDFNEVLPVPSDEQLLTHHNTSNGQIEELRRQWRLDNWGIVEPIIPLNTLIFKEKILLMTFEVFQSAPVDFITYLATKHPEILIYMGYDDYYNPIKCGFIGFNGQVWPWKSEGMLKDVNGRAVYRDKHGNLRMSNDNELIENQEVEINGALNQFNFFIDKLLFWN
jgi:hypothetical protein